MRNYYIEARIAKAEKMKSAHMESIMTAIHDYHWRTNKHQLGLTFPNDIDFSDKDTLTRMGITGSKEDLLSLLEVELKDFADDYMIQFTELKPVTKTMKKVVFATKDGVGVNHKLIDKRAKSHIDHVKSKFGEDRNIIEIKKQMIDRALDIENESNFIKVKVYSNSTAKNIWLTIVMRDAESYNSARPEDKPFNIYGLRGVVYLFD